jgi:hypothetical protein
MQFQVLHNLNCSLTTGPPHLAVRVHPHMGPRPLRVSHLLSAVHPIGWTSYLGFPPLQRHLSSQPRKKQAVISCFGSVLRLFQPLNGFLASSSFVALFHATAVRGSPFRVFPSQKSCSPLEDTCSLAVIHRRAEVIQLRSCHRPFPRRPRFHAVA